MPKKKKYVSLMERVFFSDIEDTPDYLLPPPFGGGAGTWKESRSSVPDQEAGEAADETAMNIAKRAKWDKERESMYTKEEWEARLDSTEDAVAEAKRARDMHSREYVSFITVDARVEDMNDAWEEARSKIPEPRYQKIARLQRVIDDLTEILYKMRDEERDEI